MLNTFHRILLSCKSISLFNFYFIVGLRANQRLSTLIWGKAALAGRKCRPIVSPGGCEGLKSAATSWSLVTEASLSIDMHQSATSSRAIAWVGAADYISIPVRLYP